MMFALSLALGLAALPADCTEPELTALAAEAQRVAHGDETAVVEALEKGRRGPAGGCLAVRIARSARLGWVAARRTAPSGGAKETLGPVELALDELEALRGGPLDLEIEYAQVAIRAAIAAAQDERSEMGLLLDHARDLAERLRARDRRAEWPRPFNLLAGELWFEVDRYEEARDAFARAAQAGAGAVAHVGLARALARLGRRDEACAAFARARDASKTLRDSARADLGPCR